MFWHVLGGTVLAFLRQPWRTKMHWETGIAGGTSWTDGSCVVVCFFLLGLLTWERSEGKKPLGSRRREEARAFATSISTIPMRANHCIS